MKSLTEAEGLELVATEFVGAGQSAILRLVVDGPDGVNLDQCAAISRQASAMLDVDEPMAHGYTLEVSSPGLDRRLYSEADYDRFVGRNIEIRMAPSYRTHRKVNGELQGLQEGTVQVREETGTIVGLPYSEIFEARLEIDWESVMKKGKCGR
ncbi:MAG: ribosome maturation factor RimP [Thermoanaerobaculales bacterium]|nr:ribosome maturation factor RimP [Thermoanaerobaculales bacterium]